MNSITYNPNTEVSETSLDINMDDFEYVATIVKDKRILEYFIDPPCTDCWGFEPVLRELEEKSIMV